MKRKDITGQRFNDLVAIQFNTVKRDSKDRPFYLWEFLCDCGNSYIGRVQEVKRGRIKSCGCRLENINKTSRNGNWSGYKEIPGRVFGHYKRAAKKRDIKFDITIEDLSNILNEQNFKCTYTGIFLDMNSPTGRTPLNASLDRIDSSKGYILGNIQWVYKPINNLKNDLTHNQFIDLCRLVVENHGRR